MRASWQESELRAGADYLDAGADYLSRRIAEDFSMSQHQETTAAQFG